MTDYKAIFGKKIKFLTTDLSAAEAEGEVFYSDTDKGFKVGVAGAAFSSGSALSNEIYSGAGAGIQTAALCFGGAQDNVSKTLTEEYNGSGWSTGGAMNTARHSIGGLGTQTAALGFGGYIQPGGSFSNASEEYDGSSWTASNNLNTTRYLAGGSGIQTAGVCFGGLEPPNSVSDSTEEYNGTSWTSGEDMNTDRKAVRGDGTLTSTLAWGGNTGSVSNATELYDRTDWTNGENMNTARAQGDGAGNQTSAIQAGGSTGSATTAAETYDGTDWATSPASLATARYDLSAGGTGATSGVFFSGFSPGAPDDGFSNTEEFNFTAMTVTAGAWASGTNFPEKTTSGGGAGTNTAALTFGGNPPSAGNLDKSYEYDGSTWTAEATLSDKTAGSMSGQTGFGVQTAAVACADNSGGPPYTYVATIEYDGSSWANGEDRPGDRYSSATCGILTAGLTFGGRATPGPGGSFAFNTTLEYDGTDWTSGGNMNTGRDNFSGSGTQTAAVGGGGYSSVPTKEGSHTEEYDGSSWTNSNNQIYDTRMAKQSGTQTDTLSMGGTPGFKTSCQRYDGTSWATSPSMATGRYNQFVGTQATAGTGIWGSAGYGDASPNRLQTTEYFTDETTALNLKTITDS